MEKCVGNLAVRVINVLLTAHAGNTVLDTCPHGCAVRACIGQYCPGAWSITHTENCVLYRMYCTAKFAPTPYRVIYCSAYSQYRARCRCHVQYRIYAYGNTETSRSLFYRKYTTCIPKLSCYTVPVYEQSFSAGRVFI